MALQNPFVLIRQAIAHAQFDDPETRETLNTMVDKVQVEIDAIEFEFSRQSTIEAQRDLQRHLIDLLTEEQAEEDHDDATETVVVRSAGEITSEPDEE